MIKKKIYAELSKGNIKYLLPSSGRRESYNNGQKVRVPYMCRYATKTGGG